LLEAAHTDEVISDADHKHKANPKTNRVAVRRDPHKSFF
jgi:hypothetical protein